MMLRYAALAVVLAAAVPERARGMEVRNPTLEQALKRAKIVAYGQIEKIERRGGRTIATMRVDHLARGTTQTVLTYFVDVSPGFEPSTKLGDRQLVFLEPTETLDVSLKIAMDGAVLATFESGGELYAAASDSGGVQLPFGLCDPAMRRGSYSCAGKLDTVLGLAGLHHFYPKGKQPATFRIVSQTCAPCELGPWMEKASTPGATDCGSTSLRGESSSPIACVQYALGAKKPFKVVLQRQGTDSIVRSGFVSDGVTSYELLFDSSVMGGLAACAARIEQRRCRSLEVQKSQPGDWLRCAEPRESKVLCAQRGESAESLGPPRTVEDLRCEKGYPGGSFFDCAIGPGSPRRSKSVPSSTGPNLICKPLGGSERLVCQPE